MRHLLTEVFDTLGPGHTESVYHRALEVAMRLENIQYDSEVVVPVLFRNHIVGNIRCDVIVDGVILELKAVSRLNDDHRQQLRNYLKILNKPLGLLVNFGSSLSVEEIQHPIEQDPECPHVNPPWLF